MKVVHKISFLLLVVLGVSCQKNIEETLKGKNTLISLKVDSKKKEVTETQPVPEENVEEKSESTETKDLPKYKCKAIKQLKVSHYAYPPPPPEYEIKYYYIDMSKKYPVAFPDSSEKPFCDNINSILIGSKKEDGSYGFGFGENELKVKILDISPECSVNYTPGSWPEHCGVLYSAKP